MKTCIQLRANDNVANVLEAIIKNDTLSISGLHSDNVVVAVETIRRYHKIAISDIGSGADVVRDGYVIGRTLLAVKRGEHVHVHNLESKRA